MAGVIPGAVNLDEIVAEVAEGANGGMILKLAAECIRQPSVAPGRHAHGEIPALGKAGADVIEVVLTFGLEQLEIGARITRSLVTGVTIARLGGSLLMPRSRHTLVIRHRYTQCR